MTKRCITCKYFDDYFTHKCENPESAMNGTERSPMSGCRDWTHYTKSWDEKDSEVQGARVKDE